MTEAARTAEIGPKPGLITFYPRIAAAALRLLVEEGDETVRPSAVATILAELNEEFQNAELASSEISLQRSDQFHSMKFKERLHAAVRGAIRRAVEARSGTQPQRGQDPGVVHLEMLVRAMIRSMGFRAGGDAAWVDPIVESMRKICWTGPRGAALAWYVADLTRSSEGFFDLLATDFFGGAVTEAILHAGKTEVDLKEFVLDVSRCVLRSHHLGNVVVYLELYTAHTSPGQWSVDSAVRTFQLARDAMRVARRFIRKEMLEQLDTSMGRGRPICRTSELQSILSDLGDEDATTLRIILSHCDRSVAR
jgi:hypothetical protein